MNLQQIYDCLFPNRRSKQLRRELRAHELERWLKMFPPYDPKWDDPTKDLRMKCFRKLRQAIYTLDEQNPDNPIFHKGKKP